MALSKSIETGSGVNATYWKITRASYNVIEETANYTLSGYYNKEAADAKMTPLSERSFALSGITGPDKVNRAELYGHAKLQPEFVDADDV